MCVNKAFTRDLLLTADDTGVSAIRVGVEFWELLHDPSISCSKAVRSLGVTESGDSHVTG